MQSRPALPIALRPLLPTRSAWPWLAAWAGALAVVLVSCQSSSGGVDIEASDARLIASPEPGWPQFRGPRRDGISNERGLLAQWPEGGPRLLWTATNLGQGFSSPVISGGRIFLTGDVGDELRLFALDIAGRHRWTGTNGRAWSGQYPGARASATYQAERLYHLNAHGRLASVDAATGRELWAVEVLSRFGGANITWALSECVVVDERLVYVTAGGKAALFVALDRETGEVRWRSEPLYDSEVERGLESASYASPILVGFADRRLLLGCSQRHLVCVDADTGVIQWTRRFPTSYSVLALMPALVGDAVFVTAPHGKGGRLVELLPPVEAGGKVGSREVWATPFDALQGCVVVQDGRLYGAYYQGRKGWAALDAATGRALYDAPEFVKGAVLAADHRLYALCEDGWMLLLEPQSESFAVRGRFRLVEARARDAWAHPVIHDRRLYLRYHEILHCYDLER